MRFRIRHQTRFIYDAPVTLGPTTVRMRPRDDGAQRVVTYRLDVEPSPVGRAFVLDAEGNAAERLWFDGTTDRLTLSAAFEVLTLRSNPYEFLLDAAAVGVPVTYKPADAAALARFRSDAVSGPVAELAERIRAGAGRATEFLRDLTLVLSKEMEQITREEGDAYPAEQTLREGRGACRDVAVLFVEAARAAGLAARFVSGYQEPQLDRPVAMHAWAEAFVPEAGWRGYDPAAGIAVSDRHVALAAGASPAGASPTEGTFGGIATSRMEIDLAVEVTE